MIPEGVESGHFRYHIKQLETRNLITKVERGLYRLSSAGLFFVDNISLNKHNPEKTPKFITYTLVRDKYSLGLYRKGKEPFKDKLNMVSGKVHQNELSLDASIRELKEKCEIYQNHLVSINRCGAAEIIIQNKTDVVSHFIAVIYKAEVKEIDDYKNILEIYNSSVLLKRDDLAPDFKQLFMAVNSGKKDFYLDIRISH